MPSTQEKHEDFEIQLPFCSQKANLDEKAMAPKVACTLDQRRNGDGQGLSGTWSLPKGQDLPGQTLWATGERRDGAEGITKLKSSEKEHENIREKRRQGGVQSTELPALGSCVPLNEPLPLCGSLELGDGRV